MRLPVLLGDLVDTRRGNEGELPADDCNQDVERAELARGVSDDAVDVGARFHVAYESNSHDASCGGFCSHLVGALSIDIDDGKGATRRSKCTRDRASDAATPAPDDQRAFSLEHLSHGRDPRGGMSTPESGRPDSSGPLLSCQRTSGRG